MFRSPLQRMIVGWSIGFALLLAAFIITVSVLGATLYSANGFAHSYLDALARHDATTARELPGVDAAGSASTALLTGDALGSLSRIRLVSDRASATGVHAVTYSYRLGAKTATTTFSVRQTGAFLGMFPRWKFTKSPLATVSVTVQHDSRFRANGLAISNPTSANATAAPQAVPYVVFAPGLYSFDHKSNYLAAAPVSVPVSDPGSVTPVSVDVQANALFRKDVASELDKYLTQCTTQKVLLPSACPFGKSFDNRVVSTPTWAMRTYPKVTIVPDQKLGTWLVPSTRAVAHLRVRVQSLFDGTISTFDSDVLFPISYSIVIAPDNHLTITSLFG